MVNVKVRMNSKGSVDVFINSVFVVLEVSYLRASFGLSRSDSQEVQCRSVVLTIVNKYFYVVGVYITSYGREMMVVRVMG